MIFWIKYIFLIFQIEKETEAAKKSVHMLCKTDSECMDGMACTLSQLYASSSGSNECLSNFYRDFNISIIN